MSHLSEWLNGVIMQHVYFDGYPILSHEVILYVLSGNKQNPRSHRSPSKVSQYIKLKHRYRKIWIKRLINICRYSLDTFILPDLHS